MQIVHLNAPVQRIAVQVALIKATDTDYNYYFEEALQAFEGQYEADKADCMQTLRRKRGLQTEHKVNATKGRDYAVTWKDNSVNSNSSAVWDHLESQARRRMQTNPPIGVWNPHHEMLVPSIYFWRYDGSFTEPPCGEFATWFISDEPMRISKDQLARMKHVLFTHIDRNCELTSVHFDQSVARPIQSTAGRPVWHCTSDDFLPDTGIVI
jgi:hypothetical protein